MVLPGPGSPSPCPFAFVLSRPGAGGHSTLAPQPTRQLALVPLRQWTDARATTRIYPDGRFGSGKRSSPSSNGINGRFGHIDGEQRTYDALSKPWSSVLLPCATLAAWRVAVSPLHGMSNALFVDVDNGVTFHSAFTDPCSEGLLGIFVNLRMRNGSFTCDPRFELGFPGHLSGYAEVLGPLATSRFETPT